VKARWILELVLLMLALGCNGSSTPTTTTAQTVARDSVLALDTAWQIGAEACMQVAITENNDGVRQKCAAAFGPARSALLLTAGLVDSWNAAAQGQIGCALADLSASFGPATALLTTLGINVPAQVQTGLTLAATLVPQCVAPSDAGADAAPADGGSAPTPPLSPEVYKQAAALVHLRAVAADGGSK
jgi:hypothetical protein